jgi:hypothetical protein
MPIRSRSPRNTQLPLCPVCGIPVDAVESRSVVEREDDGHWLARQIVLYCPSDGARWQWEDRWDDSWTFDAASTAFINNRRATNTEP